MESMGGDGISPRLGLLRDALDMQLQEFRDARSRCLAGMCAATAPPHPNPLPHVHSRSTHILHIPYSDNLETH